MHPLASPHSLAGVALILLTVTSAPAQAGSLDRFRDVFSGPRYDGFRFGYGAFLGERHDDKRPPGHLGQWDRPEEPPPRDTTPEPPVQARPDDMPDELEDRAR